jgi:hypothetical protein
MEFEVSKFAEVILKTSSAIALDATRIIIKNINKIFLNMTALYHDPTRLAKMLRR